MLIKNYFTTKLLPTTQHINITHRGKLVYSGTGKNLLQTNSKLLNVNTVGCKVKPVKTSLLQFSTQHTTIPVLCV